MLKSLLITIFFSDKISIVFLKPSHNAWIDTYPKDAPKINRSAIPSFNCTGIEIFPADFFKIQEEAKVLIERDKRLKPQFVAIIHNKFDHPAFPGERVPWYQVYVYSDYFKDMPLEERKEIVRPIISEKLFESGFHRVSFNCLTMEEDQRTETMPEWEVGGPTTPKSAEEETEGPVMKLYRKAIEKNIKCHHLELIDSSDFYHFPQNSEKFLTILVVTDIFKGKTEWERENMVTDILKKEMPWDIRGLALIPFSISEYENAPDKKSEDKLKKIAAIKHTLEQIKIKGYLNTTTTLSWNAHMDKIEDLADRCYGEVGDKNIKDTSGINEAEREMIFHWHQYNQDFILKNDQRVERMLATMAPARELEVEQKMKENPLYRDAKKICTMTSYERRLQEFDDEKKRFHWDPEEDFETITPNKYYESACDCGVDHVAV